MPTAKAQDDDARIKAKADDEVSRTAAEDRHTPNMVPQS